MHKSPRNKYSYQSNRAVQTNLYSPNHNRSNTNSESVKSLGKSILPSQRIIFKELVEELGIEDQSEFRKIKATLRQKYSKHLSLLQGHTLNLQRFRHSQRKQIDSQKKRLEEMKTEIQYKQSRALERKEKQQKNLLNKYENQQQKWKQIIEKNKQQYLRNIKNSMKLIKRWENKLIVSSNKKSQQINKIIVQAHDHNTYVQDICQRSRLIEDEVNQQRIMLLEKKLSLKTELNQPRSMSKRSLKSNKNYQFSTPKKFGSERTRQNENLRRSRTLGPEKQVKNLQNSNKLKIQEKTDSRNFKNPQSEEKRMGSSSSNQQLLVKNYLDQAQFEEKVEKSYMKQKRISDARMVKDYMNRQKLKQNKMKQQEMREKIQQNITKMKEQEQEKNRKLNEKFNEDRRKNRFISNSPNSYQKQEDQRSFPALNSKQELFQIQDRMNKKYGKKNSHSVKVNKLDFDYSGVSLGNPNQGNIYVTDPHNHNHNRWDQQKDKKGVKSVIKKSRVEKRKKGQQMNHKYNKKILQKLRSISLIANIKEKQLLSNQQPNA